ncbi:Hypothetical protein GSB_152826 [Giardia duodenalis]|uniref:Uncharacterized protein n=2 Tax=Giardia intestinalis TaxID=5741 RepID=C6LTV9_GIAIB|nr:Hypothetical protein GL50581_2205 [Giardia intestinalis ATCC 50581]ESU41647.1 Hypothetical protein GSB_152826 [Giardia intestinalis]
MYQSSSDSEIETPSRVIRLQKPQHLIARPFANVYYEITSSFNLLFTGMVNNNIVYGKGLKMEQTSTLCPCTPAIKQAIIVGNVYVVRAVDSLAIYSDAGVHLMNLDGAYTHIEALSPHLFAAVGSKPEGSFLKLYDTTGTCLYQRQSNAAGSPHLRDAGSPREREYKIVSSYSTAQKGVTDICITTADVLIVLHIIILQHNTVYYRTRAKSKPFRSPKLPVNSKMKCKVEPFVNELHSGLLCSFELLFNAAVFDVVGVSTEKAASLLDVAAVSSSSLGNDMGDLEEHNIRIFIHDTKQRHVLSFVLSASTVEPLKNQSKYFTDTSTMKISAGNFRILKNGIENRLFYNEYDNSLIDFPRNKRYSFQEKPYPSGLQDSAALVLFHPNYNMNKCTLAMVSPQSVPNVQLLMEMSIPTRLSQNAMTLDRLATGNVAIPVENLFSTSIGPPKISTLPTNINSPLVTKKTDHVHTHDPVDVLSVVSDDVGQLLANRGSISSPALNQPKEVTLPLCKSDPSFNEIASPKPRPLGPSTVVSIHPQNKQSTPGQQQAPMVPTFPLNIAERIEKNIQKEMAAGLSCISDLLAPKVPLEVKTASKLHDISVKLDKINKTVDELGNRLASTFKKEQKLSKVESVTRTMEALLSQDFHCRYEDLSFKEDGASANQDSNTVSPLLHTLDEIYAMLPRETQENIIPELPDGVSTQSLLIQYIHSIVFRETMLVTTKMLHSFEREFAFRMNERIKEMMALAENRTFNMIRESVSGCIKKCQQIKVSVEQKQGSASQQRTASNDDRTLQELISRITACEQQIRQVSSKLNKPVEQPKPHSPIPHVITSDPLPVQRLTIPKAAGPMQQPPPEPLHTSVSLWPSGHTTSAPVTPQSFHGDGMTIPRPNLTVNISKIKPPGL